MSVSVKLCEIFWYDIDCLWSPWTCWLRCNWRSRLWVDVGPDPESLGSRFKWRESLHLRSQIQSIHPSTFHQPESFHPDQNPASIFGFCDLHRLPRRLWWKEIALEQVFHVNAMGRGGDPGDPWSSRSCRWLQCLPTNFWSHNNNFQKTTRKRFHNNKKSASLRQLLRMGALYPVQSTWGLYRAPMWNSLSQLKSVSESN